LENRRALIEASLERVVEIAGDPKDRVYARLFKQRPDFEELFCMDVDGSVRANMFATSINCLLGVADGSDTPRLLLEAARMDHDGYGLDSSDIDLMFSVMRDEFRHLLGSEWTQETEAAWSSLLQELEEIGRLASA